MARLTFCSFVISGVLALCAVSVNASVLRNDEIKSLVSGNVIFLKIPIGGEFPLRYEVGGIVRGDGSGIGLAKYFSPKDQGRWWVKDNKLCQKWEEWYKGKTACFVISDLNGKKFRWKRNDGKKGSGRVK